MHYRCSQLTRDGGAHAFSKSDPSRTAATAAPVTRLFARVPVVVPVVALLIALIGASTLAQSQAPTPPRNVRIAGEGPPPVPIAIGANLQQIVNSHPEGTTFLLKTGVHRLQTVTPKDRQEFIGEPGTVMSGAQLLTNWQQFGATWYVTGQTQQGSPEGFAAGVCMPDAVRCLYPEDLFFDDQPLFHTDSLAAGGPGKWFFASTSGTIRRAAASRPA
jgi:hypothetical protein